MRPWEWVALGVGLFLAGMAVTAAWVQYSARDAIARGLGL